MAAVRSKKWAAAPNPGCDGQHRQIAMRQDRRDGSARQPFDRSDYLNEHGAESDACRACGEPLCLDSPDWCPDHMCSACFGPLLPSEDPDAGDVYCGLCRCTAPGCEERRAVEAEYGCRYCEQHECPRCGGRADSCGCAGA